MEYITQRGVIGSYYRALAQSTGAGWVNLVANEFDSDQELERYAWLGQVPVFREWIAGRSAKRLREDSFTIRNKHYEATIDIHKKDLRRDKSGQAMIRINDLAARTLSHKASLLSALIALGPSTACYDGQFFFDTDHEEGDSGAQDNDITVDISTMPVATAGTTTNPAVAEMQWAITKGITQLVSFVDNQGEPMNEGARSFLVYVPIALWPTALNAVATPAQIAETQTAMEGLKQQGFSIRVEPDPRSSWTDSFAVFRTDSPVRPFIFQKETEVELAMKWLDSEYCFDNDAVQIGVDQWCNVGFGMWQNACYVTMI